MPIGRLWRADPGRSASPRPSRRRTKPWIDPALLAAAKKEGPLVVYSSTNEQEGLPLFKIFDEATGIKVKYVRAADTPLMARIAIEFRAKPEGLGHPADHDHQQAAAADAGADRSAGGEEHLGRTRAIRAGAGTACTRTTTRPAYNTKLVKPDELPKTYEEFLTKKQWAGRVAIDGTDNEWLKAMFEHYGEQQRHRDDQGHRRDAQADHHRRASGAGARDRRRRIRDLAQQLRQPDDQREARAAGRSTSGRWIRWR